MFAKINRINENNDVKELVVDLNEIAFLSEAKDHINYEKPTKFEDVTDEETGETTQEPVEWETEKRYVLGFKNGKHPQFLDKENYDKLCDMLLK